MEESSDLVIESRPKLRSPYVVCGIDGSVNSGNVSVAGIEYLIEHFNAVKFASLTTARYHLYYSADGGGTPPIFRMDEGLIVEADFPKDEFFYAPNPDSDHDLVFFKGTEPNLYWEEYADTVVRLARQLGAARLYAFGAILERMPYTKEPRITCTCTGQAVKDEMARYSVAFSSRHGAATINQMLLYSCKKEGLEGVGLTSRVPYYPEFSLAIQYSPFAVKAILLRLNDLMDLHLDFTRLDDDIKEIQGKLDFVRQQNSQFNRYIEELEKNYTETPYEPVLDISPNEAIRLAEELLKQSKDKPPES